jgi:hypothetical protein
MCGDWTRGGGSPGLHRAQRRKAGDTPRPPSGAAGGDGPVLAQRRRPLQDLQESAALRLAILAGGLREDRHLPGLKPLAGSVCRTADRAVPKAALRVSAASIWRPHAQNVDEAFDQSQSRNGFAPGQRDCVRSMVRDTGRKQPCDFMTAVSRLNISEAIRFASPTDQNWLRSFAMQMARRRRAISSLTRALGTFADQFEPRPSRQIATLARKKVQ